MKRRMTLFLLAGLTASLLCICIVQAQEADQDREGFLSSINDLEQSILQDKKTVAEIQQSALEEPFLKRNEDRAKEMTLQQADNIVAFQKDVLAAPVADSQAPVPDEEKADLALLEPVKGQDVEEGVGDIDRLLGERKEKKVTLDFEKLKLDEALRMVAEEADINIIVDPSSRDREVTLHLKDVAVSEAIELILQAYELSYAISGNSVFVASRNRIASMAAVHKIIRLKNINAEDAKNLVKGLAESVSSDRAINALLVVGTISQIKDVEKVIAEIDKPRAQVLLITQLIEVDKDALSQIGVDWSDKISVSFQESNFDPKIIGTKITDPVNALNIYRFTRTPMQLDAAINMLIQTNKAKILSNPKIATVNGEEASVFIGDRIPYEITTVTGGVANTEVRFTEAGIRLNITPSIIADDYVVVNVKPEVSFIYSWRGEGDQYPWVRTREAFASVKVKNNQPFILAGLLSEEEKKNIYKVPFLGDIPFIKWAFRYEKITTDSKEVIITVIPQIIKD